MACFLYFLSQVRCFFAPAATEEKEETIRVIIYSSRNDRWLEGILSWLDQKGHAESVVVCRNRDDLRRELLSTQSGMGIVLLRAENAGELGQLMTLRRHLSRGRVVVVHGNLTNTEAELAYNLHPRFVGHEELDLMPLYQVLVRMMETLGLEPGTPG